MQPRDVVIVSACRTAIGKFQGQFKDVSARELAITAGKEAIRRAGIDINTIDEIVMGECYTAMQGSLPARQVSMRIGLPIESSAVTVNQNCASGMRALEIACNNIQLGKTDIGLVVGVENMTQAPFLLPKARMGYRMGGIPTEGGAELYDSMIHDALYDALVPGHMGVTADNVAKLCNVSRQECDELAVISHNRACAAIDAGKFKDEIIPVILHNKKKGDIAIDTDEHPIRNCSYETIAKMKAVFTPDGVTTAANASGINDAAAAVIVMSADKAKELGLKPMAKMINMCSAGVEPKYMGIGPAYAIPKCLKGVSMEPGALDKPMYADDPRIYPIYEKCEKHQIPVILMLGGRAGPDITYSDPKIINRIAADFPRTNFIISHGGWPWVQQILGVCFFQKNIYLCPDMYLFNCSGAADYIMAANNFMQDRFLYGSAYPLMPIVDCVSHFKGLFKPEVLPKLLYKNAAKLLNIELPEEA